MIQFYTKNDEGKYEKVHYTKIKQGVVNFITEQKINEITDELYGAYGSGTGILFGIPSNLRSAVRAIVKVVLTRRDKGTK